MTSEEAAPESVNLYRLCHESTLSSLEEDIVIPDEHFRYLVNHDTGLFVDINKVTEDVHSLPLLTVEGNDRGGGDFDPSDDPDFPVELIGAWARARISVQNNKPVRDNMEELILVEN